MAKTKKDTDLYFVIIAKGDVPVFGAPALVLTVWLCCAVCVVKIYEAQLTPNKPQKEDLIQFIIHAALDCVDQKVWSTTNM